MNDEKDWVKGLDLIGVCPACGAILGEDGECPFEKKLGPIISLRCSGEPE